MVDLKKANTKIIKDFLDEKEVFFGKLQDDGIFDKSEFEKYTKAVYNLSKEKLLIEEKYDIVITIWEISYKILDLLGSDSDPEHFYEIDNLEGDDYYDINQILYYTANWFSHGKEMDESSLTIGSWA